MKLFVNFFFFLILQCSLEAQSFVLLGDEYQSGDIALTDIKQKTNIYYSKSSQNNAVNLYHTPFFVFKSNAEGTGLDVRLLDIPGSINRKQVKITILNSPFVKKQSIIQSIINSEYRNPTNPELKSITENNLITIDLLKINVSQFPSSSNIIFPLFIEKTVCCVSFKI